MVSVGIETNVLEWFQVLRYIDKKLAWKMFYLHSTEKQMAWEIHGNCELNGNT
jgi:hypothetical protein